MNPGAHAPLAVIKAATEFCVLLLKGGLTNRLPIIPF